MTLLINPREFLKRLSSWDKKNAYMPSTRLILVNSEGYQWLFAPSELKYGWTSPQRPPLGPGAGTLRIWKGWGCSSSYLGREDFGFWSHLGCSWAKRHHYLAVKVSFRVAREKIWKYIFDMDIFNAFYLLHSYNPSFLNCLCFSMVSFRGQKELGPRPDRSPLGV